MTARNAPAPQIALPRPAGTGPRIAVRAIADRAIWLGVFLGGFVLFEPAPYELFLAAVIPLFFLGGLPLRSSFGPLIACLLVYAAGGLLAVTQVGADVYADSIVYMAVSLFLALSAVWFAALVADDPARIRLVEHATIAAAVIAALAGILGYFRLLPNADLFLLYGRARGTFQDPNVLGPFLVLPALFLARRLMTGSTARQPLAAIGLAVLSAGVFLSFSRAAWGLLVVTLALLAMVVSATAGSNRQRLRLVGLVVAGLVLAVVLVAVATSIPAIEDLLVQRARLVQEYDGKDGAELGRFARHWVGFRMALTAPLGIGPYEFSRLFIEATHNSYLKALMEYGWTGFVAYLTLVGWTIRRAVPLMLQPRPWQGFAQCVVVCFLVHLAVGWLIDTDHWRHFYMMIGLIWGLSAAERAQRAAAFAALPRR